MAKIIDQTKWNETKQNNETAAINKSLDRKIGHGYFESGQFESLIRFFVKKKKKIKSEKRDKNCCGRWKKRHQLHRARNISS